MKKYSFILFLIVGSLGHTQEVDTAAIKNINILESKVADFWGIKCAWSIGTRFMHKFVGQTDVFGLAFGMNKIQENINDEWISEIYIRY